MTDTTTTQDAKSDAAKADREGPHSTEPQTPSAKMSERFSEEEE